MKCVIIAKKIIFSPAFSQNLASIGV